MMSLPSVGRLRFLNDKIRGIQLQNDDDEINAETEGEKEFDAGENPEENEVVKVDWKLWSDQLNNSALDIANQSTDGDMINACYNVNREKVETILASICATMDQHYGADLSERLDNRYFSCSRIRVFLFKKP